MGAQTALIRPLGPGPPLLPRGAAAPAPAPAPLGSLPPAAGLPDFPTTVVPS
jgi:hypothetical protein